MSFYLFAQQFILIAFLYLEIVAFVGLLSAVANTWNHYNLSVNATASMNDDFNTVLFRIHFIYFKTTILKLFWF